MEISHTERVKPRSDSSATNLFLTLSTASFETDQYMRSYFSESRVSKFNMTASSTFPGSANFKVESGESMKDSPIRLVPGSQFVTQEKISLSSYVYN